MKRSTLITAGVLSILVFAPGAALHAQPRAAGDTIQPGYWEYSTRALFGLIPAGKDYRCVGPEDIEKFFAGPCNRHHTCTYPVRVVANGKARYEGYWIAKNDGDRANIKAEGEYSLKRFILRASGTLTNGLPMNATIDARWISDTCPPGAEDI